MMYLTTWLVIMSAGVCFACMDENEFQVNCADPYIEWELGDNFYGMLCSPNGSIVVNCLYDELSCPHSYKYSEQFDNIFSIANFNLDATCEEKLVPGCSEASDCFNNFRDITINLDSAEGFYKYFCTDEYWNQTFTCMDALRPTCPFSIHKVESSFNIVSKRNTITYTQLQHFVQGNCIKLTDTDRLCIKDYTTDLEGCGVKPSIQLQSLDGTADNIQCNYTDQTKRCVTEVCNSTVADFFVTIFENLQCGVTQVACNTFYDSEYGVIWPLTLAGFVSKKTCNPDYFTGTYDRRCSFNGIWDDVITNCVLNQDVLDETDDQIDELLDPSKNVTSEDVSAVLNTVSKIVDEPGYVLDPEELEDIVENIEDIVDIVADNDLDIQVNGTVNLIVESISELLSPDLENDWIELANEEEKVTASTVLEIVEDVIFGIQESVCDTLNTGEDSITSATNLHLNVGKRTNADIIYPPTEQSPLINTSNANIVLSRETLINGSLNGDVCFGGAYFTTINNYIEGVLTDDGVDSSFQPGQKINSVVISLQISEVTDLGLLAPPATITFYPLETNFDRPVCVFWQFDKTSNSNGGWSKDGCSVKKYSLDPPVVVCECNHLTNFAVLMSSTDISAEHAKALSIISAAGCAISMLCLVITIILHVVVWRLVRSNRSVLLMNLCVALLGALCVFLVGVNRTESRVACAVIAGLIQFLFLVVFALMLLMGIEILVCVVHVFRSKFRIKIWLTVAWITPAVIVGVSLGVTQTEGYGSDKFCWLDIESGLIWAFIGPAAFVIVVNFIIIIIVFQKMWTSAILQSKSMKLRVQTGARSLCVLLPLMGVTWVFGILSVNEDTVAFTYVFCICNSLQGLFIFLFHCVFNRQIRDALKQRQARKRSLASFSSTRKQSRGVLENSYSGGASSKQISSSTKETNTSKVSGHKSKHSGDNMTDWEKEERKNYHRQIRRGRLS